MSYLVLARKYRPQTFEEVIDQSHVTQTLKNAISQNRVAHAVVFCGPRGTGKTTVARILAKSMNCTRGPTATPCNQCRSCTEITFGNAADVFEIDGASNNSVDQIRELRENLKYMPAHSPFKIYIIDEVHMLSTAAFNALLKTLEEPPAHVMFMFATTEPHKIPVTILSRCQRHDLRRIRIESIVGHLATLCRLEGYDASDDSLMALAREAGGSLRDAMSLLDQVMICAGQSIRIADVTDILGVVDRGQLAHLSQAVLDGNPARFLDIIDVLFVRGHDMKRVYTELIEYFRNLLVAKLGIKAHKLIDLPAQEIERMQRQAAPVSETQLNQILDMLFNQEAKVRYASQPKLAVESVLLKIFHTKPALPIEVLIEKLDTLRNDFQTGRSNGGRNFASDSSGAPPTHGDAPTSTALPPVSAQDVEAVSSEVTPETPPADNHTVWRNVQQAISESHPSLAAHLINSRILEHTDDRLAIELTGNDFNLNMVRRPRNLEIIQKACRPYFRQIPTITVSLNEAAGADGAPKKNKNELKNDALHHPLVAEAIDIFDGKVVDIKILKEDEQ